MLCYACFAFAAFYLRPDTRLVNTCSTHTECSAVSEWHFESAESAHWAVRALCEPVSLILGSSILLMTTTSIRTPKVLANSACSLVCPPRSNPVSNSPLRAEMTSTPTSACGTHTYRVERECMCEVVLLMMMMAVLRLAVRFASAAASCFLPFLRSLLLLPGTLRRSY